MKDLFRQAIVAGILVLILMVPKMTTGQDVGLSGRMYTGYFYNTHSNDNAFYIDRIYLGYEGALSSSVNFQVTSDVASPDSTDSYELMMKYAYVDWLQGDNASMKLGIIPMTAYDVQKRTWGFRYLRKTVMNDRKFTPSADVGASYDLQLSKKFSLSTAISNGGGFKTAETNQFKRVHLRFLFGPSNLGKSRGMNVGAYTSFEPVTVEGNGENELTFAGFTGLHAGNLITGLEGAYQMSTDTDSAQMLLSVYGRTMVGEDTQGFLRFDYVDAIDASNHILNWLLMAGIEFAPTAGIKMTPHFVYSLDNAGEDDLVLKLGTEFRW